MSLSRYRKLKTINREGKTDFDEKVNKYLDDGWDIISLEHHSENSEDEQKYIAFMGRATKEEKVTI